MTSPNYIRLIERLNRFPQGAPPAEALEHILQILFSEPEAGWVAQLPIQPFTARKAARIWQMEESEARRILDTLAGRAILLDSEKNGETLYTLPPPMAGFFEFSLMRVRDDVDQRLLSELFQQYCSEEDDFMDALVGRGQTQLGRIFIHEPVIPPEIQVLDYERASEVIKTTPHRGISLCYCRFKAGQIRTACNAALEICMTFGNVAASLIKHGFAREVDVAEGLDLLQQAWDQNLVQFGENNRQGVGFICNCCGCCCEALLAARRFGFKRPVHTTNFAPTLRQETCTGCGRCVTVCPVEALGLVSAHDAQRPARKQAHLDPEICLGCGLCARTCPNGSLRMAPRPERIITPINSTQRIVRMAIERGNLQDVLFDDRTLWSHRALANALGAILKLPPVQRSLANEQLHSRFLETLFERLDQ